MNPPPELQPLALWLQPGAALSEVQSGLRALAPDGVTLFAVGGCGLTLGAIFVQGMPGLYCLIGVSACMSLMFPTIYGIALGGMKEEESKVGSAFLIMSIVGGAVLTKLQGGLIDSHGIRFSFILPAICFVFIAIFGIRSMLRHRSLSNTPHPDYV